MSKERYDHLGLESPYFPIHVIIALMSWMKLYKPIIEWSKPERKTPIQYTNAYIWTLERWQWWPYMRDSKRGTDIKNSLLDSVGEGEGGMIWENSIETYILSYVKQIASPG